MLAKQNITRIRNAVICITAALVVITIYHTYRAHLKFEERLVAQAQQTLLLLADQGARNLQHFVEEHTNYLQTITFNTEIQKFFHNESVVGMPAHIDSYLHAYFESHKDHISSLLLMNLSGTPIFTTPSGQDAEDGKGPSFAAMSCDPCSLQEKDFQITDLFFSTFTGKPTVAIAMPLSYRQAPVGIACWHITLEDLADRFFQDLRVGGRRAYVQLLDSDGTILYHPEKGQIGENMLAYRKELFPKQDWSQLKEIVGKMTRGETGRGLYQSVWWGEERRAEAKKIIAFVPVRLGDKTWSLGVVCDYSVIEGPIHDHIVQTVGLTLFILCLYFVITIVLLNTLKVQEKTLAKETALLKEKTRTAEALLKSEEAYRSLAENLPDLVYRLFPADGQMLFFNDLLYPYTGYQAEELQKGEICMIESLILEEDRQRVIETVKKALRNHEQFEVGYRIRHRDGKVRHLFEKGKPVYGPEGRPVHIDGLIIDNTERVLAKDLLVRQNTFLNNVLESLSHPFYVIDVSDYSLKLANSAARIDHSAEKTTCYALTHNSSDPCGNDEHPCPLEIIKKTHESTVVEHIHTDKDGNLHHVEVHAHPVFNRKGKLVQMIEYAIDITERKRAEELVGKSLKEKDMLLKEVHHRVKNNMQIISSLLSLQSRGISDTQYRNMFDESRNRIKAMALIHEKLYKSDDLAHINFGEYTRALVASLIRTYNISPGRIRVKTKIDDFLFGLDNAVPCGLLINELISNAMQHAFPDDREGEISVAITKVGNRRFELTVRDNGIGLPEGFDLRTARSLGMRLVSLLAEEQLAGKIEIDGSEGSMFHITFEEQSYKRRI